MNSVNIRRYLTGGRHSASAFSLARTLLAGAVFAFLLLPTLLIFPLALTSSNFLQFPPAGFGWTHFYNVFSQDVWRDSFLMSFKVAGLAAAISTVLGTLCAIAIPGGARLLSRPLELAVLAPIIMPPVVLGVAWFGLFSRLGLVGSMTAVAVSHAFLGIPLVYLNVLNSLQAIDRRLSLAARSLGANRITTFFLVVLPLVLPGVVAGAVLTIVISFDELIVALFVGSGFVATLPVTMWGQINYSMSPDIAAAAAVSVVISLVAASLFVASLYFIRRRGRQKRWGT